MQLLSGLGGDVRGVRQEGKVLDDLRLLIIAGLDGEVGEQGSEVTGRGVGDADVGHLDIRPLVRERHLRDAARRVGRRLLLDDLQHVAREGVAAALVALQVEVRQRLPILRVGGGVGGRGAGVGPGGDDGVEDGGAGAELVGAVLADDVVNALLHHGVQHVSAEGRDDGRIAVVEGRLRFALLGGVAQVGALEVNVLGVSLELGGGRRDDAARALAGEVLLVGAEVITLSHQAREEGGQEALGELVSAFAGPRRAQGVAPGVVSSGGRSHLQHARGVLGSCSRPEHARVGAVRRETS